MCRLDVSTKLYARCYQAKTGPKDRRERRDRRKRKRPKHRRERKIRAMRSDTPYTRWLRASRESAKDAEKARALMRKKDVGGFYRQVFRTMQKYIGVRFSMMPEGITEEIVDEKVGPAIKNAGVTEKIKSIFQECYLARYAPLELGEKDMKKTFEDLSAVIGSLNSITNL